MQDAIDKYYGEFKGEPEANYDITLHINLTEVKDPEAAIKKLSLVKSKITGGVFERYFSNLLADKPNEKLKFDLRRDTSVYLCPSSDRVTVVFSVDFVEKVDKCIADTILREFVAQKKNVNNAPSVLWMENPPQELVQFGVTKNEGCLGYAAFAFMKTNLKKPDVAIWTMLSFRTFLQYHIKCSKSLFHSKMRRRVAELQKVLNRAKVPDPKKEKKTAAGKTFKRG